MNADEHRFFSDKCCRHSIYLCLFVFICGFSAASHRPQPAILLPNAESGLKADITNANKKAKAEARLQNIIGRLFKEDTELIRRLNDLKITTTSDGESIRKALIALKSGLLDADRDDLILIVNEIIIDEAGNN